MLDQRGPNREGLDRASEAYISFLAAATTASWVIPNFS
jgi:hypothetical protein